MPIRPPRVSIVMPLYNAAAYVAEAIDSVLAQPFDDWELLIVDDGSTDGSVDIARAASSGSAGRLRVVNHSAGVNRGTRAARNLGLAHARADLIAWLDADDVFAPDSLAERVELL